jgi:cytochrome c biogenesis protein CcmG/thiol:disulfide interchange protein DsbE
MRRLTRRSLLHHMASTGGLLAINGLIPRFANANDLRVGRTAPPATLAQLDGKHVSTTELIGQVVILTFWATWCAPCREELPLLSEYAAQHAADGLTVLGFCLDTPDKLTDVKRIAQSLSFPVGLFAASSAPGYGRIWKLPVNFTIDRKGVLIDDGWKDKTPEWTLPRLEQVVSPLLRSAPGS